MSQVSHEFSDPQPIEEVHRHLLHDVSPFLAGWGYNLQAQDARKLHLSAGLPSDVGNRCLHFAVPDRASGAVRRKRSSTPSSSACLQTVRTPPWPRSAAKYPTDCGRQFSGSLSRAIVSAPSKPPGCGSSCLRSTAKPLGWQKDWQGATFTAPGGSATPQGDGWHFSLIEQRSQCRCMKGDMEGTGRVCDVIVRKAL